MSHQYLSYFLEDDEELMKIQMAYESSEISNTAVKDAAISEIWKFIQTFQERRANITEEEVSIFMDGNRPLRLATQYNWQGTVCSIIFILMKKNFVPPPQGVGFQTS